MVELDDKTHSLLKKVKQKIKKRNPLYKTNNNIVLHHALSLVEKGEAYELSVD